MSFSDPNAESSECHLFGTDDSGMASVKQQRRGWRLGCLATLLILLASSALIGALSGISLTWGPTVIPVNPQPTLIVESQASTDSVLTIPVIHIHAGPRGQIAIQPDRLLGIPFGLAEVYHESSDHRTVIYDYSSPDTASGSFDITVPPQTNLHVDTNGWAVQVEGITGQMVVTTNAGPLMVHHCHLLGPSLLRSASGDLSLASDQLSGEAAIDDTSGAITFQGALDPQGSYRFTNNQGTITATLLPNAPVQIDAVTSSGALTSTDLPGRAQNTSNGMELHTEVGAAPRAELSLSTNQGSITITREGANQA